MEWAHEKKIEHLYCPMEQYSMSMGQPKGQGLNICTVLWPNINALGLMQPACGMAKGPMQQAHGTVLQHVYCPMDQCNRPMGQGLNICTVPWPNGTCPWDGKRSNVTSTSDNSSTFVLSHGLIQPAHEMANGPMQQDHGTKTVLFHGQD